LSFKTRPSKYNNLIEKVNSSLLENRSIKYELKELN